MNPMKTANVFGAWLMTAGPIDHYFLNGTPLCTSTTKPGLPRPYRAFNRGDKTLDTRFRCPTCHRLNLERWRTM